MKSNNMSPDSVASGGEIKTKEVITNAPSLRHGELGLVNDPGISDFYGNSVTESYRLKSELIASHLTEIGMGK